MTRRWTRRKVNETRLNRIPFDADSHTRAIITSDPHKEEPAAAVSQLTGRMARGDEAAFHEFDRLYFHRLLRYLLVLAGGREEIARDAMQLTYLRVARYVRQFEAEAAFWRWLSLLARSSFADETRKHIRYQGMLGRYTLLEAARSDPGDPDADARFRELLNAQLAHLPAPDRELLRQKYLDGESVRSLAQRRETTEKALESQLLRIRRKLRTLVLDRLRDETDD